MKAGKSVDEASVGYKVPERFKSHTGREVDDAGIYDELLR